MEIDGRTLFNALPLLLLLYYVIRDAVTDHMVASEREFRRALERLSVPGGGRD